jgi:hypothetical protein
MVIDNIKVWAQMFFDDGSVSVSIRLCADIYDDNEHITKIAHNLLQTVNRTEGLLLIWGAGQIIDRYYVTSSSSLSQESNS